MSFLSRSVSFPLPSNTFLFMPPSILCPSSPYFFFTSFSLLLLFLLRFRCLRFQLPRRIWLHLPKQLRWTVPPLPRFSLRMLFVCSLPEIVESPLFSVETPHALALRKHWP